MCPEFWVHIIVLEGFFVEMGVEGKWFSHLRIPNKLQVVSVLYLWFWENWLAIAV